MTNTNTPKRRKKLSDLSTPIDNVPFHALLIQTEIQTHPNAEKTLLISSYTENTLPGLHSARTHPNGRKISYHLPANKSALPIMTNANITKC